MKNLSVEEKLQKIADKYSNITYNDDNYYVGGGLDDSKFASRRHEDAKSDNGKLTLGQATQLFAKATEMTIEDVKEIIEFQHPNLEWHHAGKLPKQYGGGMKKTYFVNADEIYDLAQNWQKIAETLKLQKIEDAKIAAEKKSIAERREDFLRVNAEIKVRVSYSQLGSYYVEIDREMNGKYGWFSSYGRSYNLPEYYTAWVMNEENYKKYCEIQ